MSATKTRFILLCAVCALGLSACSGVKEQLGLERSAPDEFTVVKQAPLALPPDYSLRPPRLGAPRPQDTTTVQQAQTTVFGGDGDTAQNNPGVGSGEQALLAQAGANNAQPNIRQIVDHENAVMVPQKKTAMQKIGLSKAPDVSATVVNAPAEAARLKKTESQGQPVTTGQTPTVVQ